VTQMGGHGSFSDPRLGIDISQTPDLVTPKLPALLEYQLSLTTPSPPPGSFDRRAADRGKRVFSGAGRCASCHVPPTYTDVLTGPDPSVPLLHDPSATGMEPVYASRGATGQYRTTPLRALWQHAPYFHDGSAPTLDAVVDHYVQFLGLGLTDREKADLAEFLKSL
jgi:cytochrome c peroxidase